MIAGEYDLSVGSIIGLAALVAAEALQAHWPEPLAILAAFGAAAIVGAINGVLVASMRAPSLIVTLAAMFVWQGVVYVATQGFAISVTVSGVTQALFDGGFHGFAVSVIWWVALIVVLSVVLLRSRLGNHIFATGGNPAAARSLGVPVRRIKVGLYILTALTAALVGVIQLVRFGSADPTLGQNVELTAIAGRRDRRHQAAGRFRHGPGHGVRLPDAGLHRSRPATRVGAHVFLPGAGRADPVAAVLVNLYLRGGQAQR